MRRNGANDYTQGTQRRDQDSGCETGNKKGVCQSLLSEG